MEPRKHYFAKIPTIAIFIVMAMSGPLGVLLFILKGIDQKVQMCIRDRNIAVKRSEFVRFTAFLFVDISKNDVKIRVFRS